MKEKKQGVQFEVLLDYNRSLTTHTLSSPHQLAQGPQAGLESEGVDSAQATVGLHRGRSAPGATPD